jgi:hypothetical protein
MTQGRKSAVRLDRRAGLRQWPRAGAVLPLLLLITACASRAQAPAGTPVPDPSAFAAEMVRASTTRDPQRIGFTWTLNEAGSRVNGRGVVRVEAPERARLDLFGPRNETYLAAALIADAYRLPPTVPDAAALPSPAIMWGGIAVIRPPVGAELASATTTGEAAFLRYLAPDGSVYQYQVNLSGGTPRVEAVERSRGASRLETVRIGRDAAGQISRSDYRNWAEFRELVLEITEVENVATFPAGTWQP